MRVSTGSHVHIIFFKKGMDFENVIHQNKLILGPGGIA